MSKVVLVCGGRHYIDRRRVFAVLDGLLRPALIVHGDATGADLLADEWARARGVPLAVFPANWKGEGKAAGSNRNRRMLDVARPHLVVALPGGTGTRSMVDLARQRLEVNVLDLTKEGIFD